MYIIKFGRHMKKIKTLFERMDAWRHFPSYQLERRADLFFSLYLPEVLESKLGFPISEHIIPEFPVRIGTIYPNIQTDKSYKIDYVCLSEDSTKAIFVELKTEGRSKRVSQAKYLKAAQRAGMTALLTGLLDIFQATKAKRKYFCLLEYLEKMKLISIPENVKEIMSRPNIQGITKAARDIKITTKVKEAIIVYIQPNEENQENKEGIEIIPFHEFSEVVRRYDDPISSRFAESLDKWANIQAGCKRKNM